MYILISIRYYCTSGSNLLSIFFLVFQHFAFDLVVSVSTYIYQEQNETSMAELIVIDWGYIAGRGSISISGYAAEYDVLN